METSLDVWTNTNKQYCWHCWIWKNWLVAENTNTILLHFYCYLSNKGPNHSTFEIA